jgi:tetraacyldisaccharide 4'-kinase
MRTPGFWYRDAGALALLLSPLGAAYGAITAWRMRQPGSRAAVPVICVGNPVAGGAGKTPVALAILAGAAVPGERPFALTRGYGGRLSGPILVDPAAHSAADVGDEALLLAEAAPTIVARDRVAGAALATSLGATLIVMDDGLQNPALAKDGSFMVIDGAAGVGNGFCIPAGPLRAPLTAQWPHVDAVILSGAGAAGEHLARMAGKTAHRIKLEPSSEDLAALAGKPLMAFAGIGRPEKFFATLREAGLDLRTTRGFADHHPYSVNDINTLKEEAQASHQVLVTTSKDLVRLPVAARDGIAVLRVKAAGLDSAIGGMIAKARERSLSAAAGQRRA